MQDSPEISIIVPVYNCEDYLGQTLKSLELQSYTNFEVIISDDASTDKSSKIAEDWHKKDPRFKLFKHANNVGMTQNWNQALQYVTGKYVMKLDADDAFQSDTLDRLYNEVSKNNIDIAFCRTLECDPTLSIQNTYRGERAFLLAGLDASKNHSLKADQWYQLTLNDAQIWHSNAFLVPTSLMKSLGGWDEKFGCASDTDLILRLLENDIVVSHVNYPGVLYRMREGSISHEFRLNDSLINEGYTVSLQSVQRFYQSGKSLNYRAKINWYRIYKNAIERNLINRELNNPTIETTALRIPKQILYLGYIQRKLHSCKKTAINLLRQYGSKTD